MIVAMPTGLARLHVDEAELASLRRAARCIVMPAVIRGRGEVSQDVQLARFAAFGSFATLVLVGERFLTDPEPVSARR